MNLKGYGALIAVSALSLATLSGCYGYYYGHGRPVRHNYYYAYSHDSSYYRDYRAPRSRYYHPGERFGDGRPNVARPARWRDDDGRQIRPRPPRGDGRGQIQARPPRRDDDGRQIRPRPPRGDGRTRVRRANSARP